MLVLHVVREFGKLFLAIRTQARTIDKTSCIKLKTLNSGFSVDIVFMGLKLIGRGENFSAYVTRIVGWSMNILNVSPNVARSDDF